MQFQVEHIIAKKHRGGDEGSNLAFACDRCYGHKGANLSGIDPVSLELTRLFDPRRDNWDEHFFTLPSSEIEGKSDVGRTTVDVLKKYVAPSIAESGMWNR